MGKRPERQIALLAKLDIAFGYGPKGRGFESLTARQQRINTNRCCSLFIYKGPIEEHEAVHTAVSCLRSMACILEYIKEN